MNNNISLNNRYNFYIKIGKNNKLDINKDNNKDINYEIKLTSPNQGKDNISSSVIKKLIVECDLDKINKKLKSNNDKKEINVNIKPLYKKIEIDKIFFSNDKYKDETLRNTKTKYSINTTRAKSKTSRLDNKKTFKFLIHQAYKNRDLSTSFNRYYKSGQSLRGKSQTMRDNKKLNNDSFNYSNINNENIKNNDYNKPLGLKYFSSEKKDNDENN